MSDTIILHEMVPKWNRLFKQKGKFRKIRWCEVHDYHWQSWQLKDKCGGWVLSKPKGACRIVDKWLEV